MILKTVIWYSANTDIYKWLLMQDFTTEAHIQFPQTLINTWQMTVFNFGMLADPVHLYNTLTCCNML